MNTVISFLKQTDIFDGFSSTQLELVANICEQKSYELGEKILDEGESSKELYIIIRGEVNIAVNPAIVGGPDSPPHGGEYIIATLRPGQSFGEVALVDEGLRSATARASQPVTILLVLPREKLIRLCDQNLPLGYRLMYNLAADLAMKIRSTDMRIRGQLLYGSKNPT